MTKRREAALIKPAAKEEPPTPIIIDFRPVEFTDIRGICRDPKETNPFGICVYITTNSEEVFNVHFTRKQAFDMRDVLSLALMADTDFSKHDPVIKVDFKNKMYSIEEASDVESE